MTNDEDKIFYIDPATMDVSQLNRSQTHLLMAKLHVHLAGLSEMNNVCACDSKALLEWNLPDVVPMNGGIIDVDAPSECEDNDISLTEDVAEKEPVEVVPEKVFHKSIRDVRFGVHYNPNGDDVLLGRYHKNNICTSIVIALFNRLGFSEFTKDKAELTIMLLEKKHGHHAKDDAQKLEKHLASAASIYLSFLKNTDCVVHIRGKDKYKFILSPIEAFDIKVDVPTESTTMKGLSYYDNPDDNPDNPNKDNKGSQLYPDW